MLYEQKSNLYEEYMKDTLQIYGVKKVKRPHIKATKKLDLNGKDYVTRWLDKRIDSDPLFEGLKFDGLLVLFTCQMHQFI